MNYQQQQTPPPPPMNQDQGKTVATIAYLTWIGLIIAFVMHGQNRTSIGAFHLRQMLGLVISSIAMYVLILIPFLGLVLVPLVGIFLVVLWVIGFIAAINGEEKAVPVLGPFFQKTFHGIQ